MKKYIIIALLISIAGCTKKKIEKKAKPCNIAQKKSQKAVQSPEQIQFLVETIYGKNSVNLALDQIFIIQDLISSILNLSDDQQQQVATVTALLLQEKLPTCTQLQQLVYSYQLNYLSQLSQNFQDLEKIDANIITIAKKIIQYINIEQEVILNNEKNKHLFLVTSTKNPLPALINFWSSPTSQKILINYDPQDLTKIQFIAEMMIDMTVMIAAQEGASMANEQIGMQAQLLTQTISKDSQTIQTNIQAFQTKAQTNQQAKLQAMISAFSNAQKDIQTKTAQAAAISNLELDYLYKNISVDKPQQNYIFNQIQFDQLFTLGTMLTPQGALWKNPFSVGDWEYESSSNSFWQYQSSPIYNAVTDDSGKSTKSALQAENNSIFTEYCTNAASYTIAGSISLNRVDYPFFAGIIFNKSRWISGDFEAIRKSRILGIYGASATDVGVYFAQQYTMTDQQMKAAKSDDPIQTPLQQIINNKVGKRINLPGNAFTNLQNSPLTFNFEITNSPTTVTLKFWTDNNKPISVTINNLDPAIFMYHGIGFICPGAVAQFKITQPTDLIFTAQAISNYKD